MNYFCDVHIQSAKDAEKRIFIVLENGTELTKDILAESNQYKDFVQTYKPKFLMADYVTYSTEADVFASSQDEIFIELIKNDEVKKIAQSELRIENAKHTNSSGKHKKKKIPLVLVVVCALLLSLVTFGLGAKIGDRSSQVNTETNTNKNNANEDGMIIPVQNEIDENADQITISIDRSYSAVPREDIQLKGEVIDGKATITLPEFDKTDFFTHVYGYTWGFTTDPNGKKIEYYGGRSYDFTEDTKLYRVSVKYGGGSGTKEDPYLIDYYDQLELMGEEKARGYFRQTADIAFPDYAVHKPINTVNMLKNDPESEYFEYDGNGFIISGLTNPLFGKISGAVIKNVNIKDSFISSPAYMDYGFIACQVYNYNYKAENGKEYQTGETLIQHCTVSHSSIKVEYPESEQTTTEIVTAAVVVPPDLAVTTQVDENGNVIEPTTTTEPTKHGEYCIGSITGTGGQIEDCYVNDFGIYVTIDDYYLYAGGISGKPASVKNSAVYFYSAQGNIFNAGGITGNCGGSRLYNAVGEELPEYYGGCIQGCTARNIIINSEVSAGGISGEGTSNAKGAIISNCYANELQFSVGVFEDKERTRPKKTGFSGGVIGADGNEADGHLIMNTVSPSDLNPVGSRTKSTYDDSIRLAPAYAFYQENILTVINKNTVDPDDPAEIFTGNFAFNGDLFGDDSGALPYPAAIEDLFEKTSEEDKNENE